MKKVILTSAVTAIVVSLLTVHLVQPKQPQVVSTVQQDSTLPPYGVHLAANRAYGAKALADFTLASSKTVETVVHIKSKEIVRHRYYRRYSDPLAELFGAFGNGYTYGQPYEKEEVKQSSGSGVVISADGYIVTNVHVIKDADQVEVVFNDNSSLDAKIVGTDPATDIALLKVHAQQLPHVAFANSDDIAIGEWALAVGNPFNLSTTVTAGIISAKARNINILEAENAIEAFIQTDAAVNPGNSGGALVNLQGELIGINSAIASPTGSYAGYSFAVPSNIVSKVVADLTEYGIVQRAYWGAVCADLNSAVAGELGINFTQGVYIADIISDGAAYEAGLRQYEVIVKVDGQPVKHAPEVLEKLAGKRPGDKVMFTAFRNGKTVDFVLILKNEYGKTELVKADLAELKKLLGAELRDLDAKTLQRYRLRGGIQVTKIEKGELQKQTNLQKGFVITHVNGYQVSNREQFMEVLKNSSSGVVVEGFYPGYYGRYRYAFGL